MTTLLAFFIVLCSLAEDQTGANLHRGTGSFIDHLESGGLNGVFDGDKSEKAVQLESTSPLYIVGEEPDETVSRIGPDEDPNEIASRDREQEEFMRCLNALERWSSLEPAPAASGETVYDFFEKLATQEPYLPQNFDRIATRVIPLMRRKTHSVEVIVWAATPSDSARARSAKQSSSLVAELIRRADLSQEAAARTTSVCRNWPHADEKRPVMSIVIRRLSSVATNR